MRFATEVPIEAMAARPWAAPTIIGPPPALEGRVGSLMVQVDEQTALGRGFRFFVELEDGDAENLTAGSLVEFVVYAHQMVPVSVALWP